MDDQRRLLVALGLIGLVVVAMTFLWPSAGRRDPGAGQPPAPSAAADGSAAAEEPEEDAEPAEPVAAEPDAAEPVAAEPDADRPTAREVRPERRVSLKTSRLAAEVSSHGGGLAHARLLDPQYREQGADDAPPVDLVSVDLDERPELMPLAFSLVRRRGGPPAATGTAEGQGLLRFLNSGSTTSARLSSVAEIGEAVASKLVGGRPYARVEDVEKALGGSESGRARILGGLLDAAWGGGFVRLDFEVLREEEARIVLRGQTDDGLEVIRTIAVASEYELRVSDRLRNRSKQRREVRVRLMATALERRQGGGFLFGRPVGLIRGICLHGDDMIRRDRSRLAGEGSGCTDFAGCGGPAGPASATGHIRFVAAERHYFMTALTPGASWADTTCNLRGSAGDVLEVEIEPAVFTELEPGGETTYSAHAFLGPKQVDLLKQLGPGRRLWEAIDYGWFAFLSHWLLWALRLFHGWFGNWGLAIIFLTFLIKLILLPVSHKTFMNMREMQRDMAGLKPELDKINERYKDQPDVKQQKTLALYQAHGINPLKQVSGCLPMFLQMPIWIALYRMISESVELYRAPFVLWLDDLSAQDPYYILPGLLGVSMYVQQRITPQPGMDNAQAKMMRWMMPGMFLLIMLNMPAGLTLYIFVNTLLTLAQQQIINRMVPADQPGAAKAKATKAEEPATAGRSDDGAGGDDDRKKSRARRRKRK